MTGSRSPEVRTLIMVMAAIVVVAVFIARSYYGKRNRAVDPRIAKARELYTTYDQVGRSGDYHVIFGLLDSIEDIYIQVPHYRHSFEMGVISNNRCAALLTLALHGDSIPVSHNPFNGLSGDSLVRMARAQGMEAIRTYESWGLEYGGLDKDQILHKIAPYFGDDLHMESMALKADILENRVREIQAALEENDRRLSVCHTNLGVICRYQEEYEEAIRHYETAIALWDRNLEAENNLNRLLNRPLKKRNVIQRILPPAKN